MAALADMVTFQALNPDGGFEDLAIQTALNAATAAAERYCGRTFASAAATEYYDGNGYPELPLKRWPITAVAAVYLDLNGMYGQAPGGFGSTTLLAGGVDYVYVADRGTLQLVTFNLSWPVSGVGTGFGSWNWPGLTRRGASFVGWPKVMGCVKVTYTAGYAVIPADLQAAACAMAAYILIATPGGGMVQTSTTYIDVSAGSGFLTEALARGNVPALGSARAVLDSYKDFRLNRGVY